MAKEPLAPPSLVFSVIVACASTAHVGILTWQACSPTKKKYNLWPVALSLILFILNWLLVVFSSPTVRIDIALEILLSLASGCLIVYQVCFLPF
jgi:hypothetical protein